MIKRLLTVSFLPSGLATSLLLIFFTKLTLATAALNSSNPVSDLSSNLAPPADRDISISGLVATNDSPSPEGSPTTLTATITEGSNVTYTWLFGDGGTGSGDVVTHTYVDAGHYTAFVIASNAVSYLTTSTVVTITKGPIRGVIATNDSPTSPGQPTTLTATLVTRDGLAIFPLSTIIYNWNYGDESYRLNGFPVITHIYPMIGLYTAVVTVSNSISSFTGATTVTITHTNKIYLPLVLKTLPNGF